MLKDWKFPSFPCRLILDKARLFSGIVFGPIKEHCLFKQGLGWFRFIKKFICNVQTNSGSVFDLNRPTVCNTTGLIQRTLKIA